MSKAKCKNVQKKKNIKKNRDMGISTKERAIDKNKNNKNNNNNNNNNNNEMTMDNNKRIETGEPNNLEWNSQWESLPLNLKRSSSN
ncbi:kinesin family member 10, partial [Reticulomyxa filosa]